MNNSETKTADQLYLDKTDPIYLSIKSRLLSDLNETAKTLDPELAENKLIEARLKEHPGLRSQIQTIGQRSITKYTEEVQLELGMFMLVLSSFGEMDEEKMEWDVRVQHLGDDRYTGELWEDFKAMALIYTVDSSGLVTFHNPFQAGIDLLKNNLI
jgi:hypothetical protein